MRKTAGALTICAALVGAACGGGSSDSDASSTPPGPDTTITSETPSASTTGDRDSDASADEPVLEDSVDRGNASWDGADFRSLANTRMDELGATFGLAATPESVASIFEYPSDFPYPAGTVLGVFHEYQVDVRVTDEVDIDEERIVGVNGTGDAAALDNLQEVVGAGTVSRWQGASSQRAETNLDLYTALKGDGSDIKDRFMVRGTPTPETGEPYLQLQLDQAATEIPVPAWQAGLPILDGGRLTRVQEGRGIVESFGRFAEDGYVEIAYQYPLDRFDELEVLFASGIFESAGFTYQDTPFSNFDIRIDLSNGDWSGTVAVGGVSVNGEETAYQLVWSLTRPGRVDAPVPPATESDSGGATPSPAPTPRPEVDSGVESSPDSPAPLAGATFQWDDRDVQWEVVLHGLVEASVVSESNTGRCVHLVGVATPTFIDDDYSASTIDLPDLGLLAGGDYVSPATECTSTELDTAGYDEFEIDGSILGAPLNFADSFFLEGDTPATIDAVVVGDEDDPVAMGLEDDENSYFTGDIIGAIPERTAAAADLALPASSPLVGAATTIGVGRDEWDTVFHGIFEVAPQDNETNPNDGIGRCFVVVGESTPSSINAGYVTDDAPKMSLIAGGQTINGFGFCDEDPIVAAGYESHGGHGYTQGTAMSFRQTFLVPPSVADQVTTLVVDQDTDDRQFFTADLIDTLPPGVGVVDGFELPESEGAMNAAPISWTNQRGEVIDWSIEMNGLVPLGAGSPGTTCYAVVGSMTPASDVDSDFRIPDFSLIARGVEFGGSARRCDVEALETLGYVPANDAQVTAGTEVAFFDAISVADAPARELDRLIVGDASADLQSQVYDIVMIEAAPAL